MKRPTTFASFHVALLALLALGPASAARLPLPGEDTPDSHIVGGKPAKEGAWPWQGGMKRYNKEHCGCVLIATTWVVTAAHCAGEQTDAYSFHFGSRSRKTGGIRLAATQISIHPDVGVGDGTYPNDIALVKLGSPAEGTHIAVISMTSEGRDHAGNEDCWITGWGIKDPGPIPVTPPEILHEVKVPVLTEEACNNVWGSQLSEDSICVGDEVETGSCSGDSGGPLVCKVGGAYELVGVASWGIVFCWPTLPSIYTGIGFHRQWISSVSGV